MNIVDLLLSQLFAHLLADFTLQPQRWCEAKVQKFFSRELFAHTAIVFGCSAGMFTLTGALDYWIFAAVFIAVLHFGMDLLKSWLVRQQYLKKSLFFIDQFFHIIIIIAVVRLWYIEPSPWGTDFNILLGMNAILLCTKPANIFIKNFMQASGIIKASDEDSELQKAGRIIGVLERLLSFVLILNNQFAAVGFVIAAKSILRFRDKDTAKTEYVLIGSLLSFGIAILLGIFVNKLA